ncbi:hypothetical protein [Mesonia mobilis]|uniref:Uncharacterized protein n=1 Tax=Mesonia mobilis TaxID=369791 RepID=A0ABQ3BGR8_9FLAO|nr:hypothetical protein [Mesonia mobilis]MBQ0739384.1 hypothetical protein [Aquimarina celericrescens]GGZ43224.1 hypothetical protein GCM10008088_00160 [Mesonia mobilis]
MKQELTIKYRNTLQNLIILLVGIVLLVIGFIAYYWTEIFSYFYLIVLANVLVLYVLITSQVKKNQVIYDAVFIKYKLNNEPTKRLKVDEVAGVKQQEQALIVQLNQNQEATIELDNYSENAIEEFRDLINNIIQINKNK